MTDELNKFGLSSGTNGTVFPRRERPGLFFAALLLLVIPVNATAQGQQPGVLLTAHAAHSLTVEDAARKHPVHLRAVVTYYDPYIDQRRPAFFVHDQTGGIFVALSRVPKIPLREGQLVEIDGVSDAGDFAPIVDAPLARVVGEAPLPALAPNVTMTHMLTGADDGQWVEVEGVVHAVRREGENVFFDIALSDGMLIAITVSKPGADYESLVDAKIKLRGNAAPTFNHQGQMTGSHMLFPGLSTITVEEAAPDHPFATPPDQIRNLLRFEPSPSLHHRVHIRGPLTLLWPGRMLCIEDFSKGLCAQTEQTTPMEPGQIADVIGFPMIGEFTPTLAQASYQPIGDRLAAIPKTITAEQAMAGNRDAELVTIEGVVIAKDKAAKDPTLVLSSGNSVFSAVLPFTPGMSNPLPFAEGTRVRITGICSVQSANHETNGAGFLISSSFRILLRSPSDLIVVAKPSWWTPAHAIVLLGLALAATLGVLGWVVVLRRRLEIQATLLRESEQRFRHLAHHDALTGLATRVVFEDRVSVALEIARRNRSGVALLILDVDKFKQINDTYGHQAGDAVLVRTANRLLETVRASDTVVRLGGDEFVVLLHEVHLPANAETVAAKVVAALSVPLQFEGVEIPITVSVGVGMVFAGEGDADMLLKHADIALYRAKADGRHCYRVFIPSQTEDEPKAAAELAQNEAK